MNSLNSLPSDVKVMKEDASNATRSFISEVLNVPPQSVPGAHVDADHLDDGTFVIFVVGRVIEKPKLS